MSALFQIIGAPTASILSMTSLIGGFYDVVVDVVNYLLFLVKHFSAKSSSLVNKPHVSYFFVDFCNFTIKSRNKNASGYIVYSSLKRTGLNPAANLDKNCAHSCHARFKFCLHPDLGLQYMLKSVMELTKLLKIVIQLNWSIKDWQWQCSCTKIV